MQKAPLTNVTMNEVTVQRAPGGETHQLADGKTSVPMTTEQGIKVSDDQNSLRAGPRGPLLMEDFKFREKMFHFDHERIPERVVHAHGISARGFFENYESLSDITCADLFQRKGERTETFVRFSPAVGARGSFDLARDVRGFATKFYTKEGNWDLVGNNIPVFFIQDAIKFPDLVHALKEEPDTGFPQAQSAHDNFWDFASLSPESMHMAMWVMSDRGIPRSLRFIEGFGVHSFKLVDKNGKARFVKFHWKPKLGLQSVVWDEAMKINGADPDFHRRDLYQAITSGQFPEWELGLQIFDEDLMKTFPFDILDSTKIIPEEDVPIRKVGRLVLDRWVENTFQENEQVAYCVQNVVPGIDFTNDPLLQGRLFSYLDTQLKRLGGPNFTEIPVNRARGCPVHNFQQDGHMSQVNPRGRVNYEPNSWGPDQNAKDPLPRESDAGFRTYPEQVNGPKTRTRPESFADHYSQARQFWISQTRVEKQHIINAFVFELSKVKTLKIRERTVGHLRNIDGGLATAVARDLGLKDLPPAITPARPTMQNLKPSKPLSIILNGPPSLKGRKMGIFCTDGADGKLITELKTAGSAAGLVVELVVPRIGGFVTSEGATMEGHEIHSGGPSVVYDAVVLVIGQAKAEETSNNPVAKGWLNDAFLHNKFIAYNEYTIPLLQKAGVVPDGGMMKLSGAKEVAEFLALGSKFIRFWEREALCPETA